MRREHDSHSSNREDSVRASTHRFRIPSRIHFLPVFGPTRSAFSLVLLPFLVFGAGCGYHTAGHAGQLPESVTTIAVPAFTNETSTYAIGQMLTSAVIHEFTTRTRYHIINESTEAADATLRGTVLSTVTSPIAYDSNTGRVASVLIVVSMKVILTDRQGKVLYQNPAYLFREQYEASQDLASFFEEDTPAFRRLSQDFARGLVANVFEGF